MSASMGSLLGIWEGSISQCKYQARTGFGFGLTMSSIQTRARCSSLKGVNKMAWFWQSEWISGCHDTLADVFDHIWWWSYWVNDFGVFPQYLCLYFSSTTVTCGESSAGEDCPFAGYVCVISALFIVTVDLSTLLDNAIDVRFTLWYYFLII